MVYSVDINGQVGFGSFLLSACLWNLSGVFPLGSFVFRRVSRRRLQCISMYLKRCNRTCIWHAHKLEHLDCLLVATIIGALQLRNLPPAPDGRDSSKAEGDWGLGAVLTIGLTCKHPHPESRQAFVCD